jgi:hypothetical protein
MRDGKIGEQGKEIDSRDELKKFAMTIDKAYSMHVKEIVENIVDEYLSKLKPQ